MKKPFSGAELFHGARRMMVGFRGVGGAEAWSFIGVQGWLEKWRERDKEGAEGRRGGGTAGQADTHDKSISRFSQFFERPKIPVIV